MNGDINTAVDPKGAHKVAASERIVLNPVTVFSLAEGVDKDEWANKARVIMGEHSIRGSFEQPASENTFPFRYASEEDFSRMTIQVMAEINAIEMDPKPHIPGPSTWPDETCPVARSIRRQSELPCNSF